MITPKTSGRLVIDYPGDSTAYKMESDGQGTVTANSGITVLYDAGGYVLTATGSQVGAGLATMGNALIAATGIPAVEFRLDAVGGSALCVGAGGGNGNWTDLLGGPMGRLNLLASGRSPADFAIMSIGANDMGVSRPGAFRDAHLQFIQQTAAFAWDRIFMVGVGNWFAQSNAAVNEIRSAQQAAIAIAPPLTLACTTADLDTIDGIHRTVASEIVEASRIAQTILYHYGYASTSGLGPRLLGSTLSGGDVVDTYELPPGASAVAAAGMPAGHRFSKNGFASNYTPASFTILSSTTASFSFSPAPAGPLLRDYAMGNMSPDAAMIRDDTALACPLQPVVRPLVVM